MSYAKWMGRLARHAGVRVFRIFERQLAPGPFKPENRGQTPIPVRLRWMNQAEVLRRCADAVLDLKPTKVRGAFRRGDLCAGAFDGETLTAYCWFALSAAPHMDRVWLDFPADAVYTYKCFVRPEYRGRGIAGALYRFADLACLEQGRDRALICVESHNRASIAAAVRAGFSPAGYATYAGWPRLIAWSSRKDLRFFVPDAGKPRFALSS